MPCSALRWFSIKSQCHLSQWSPHTDQVLALIEAAERKRLLGTFMRSLGTFPEYT